METIARYRASDRGITKGAAIRIFFGSLVAVSMLGVASVRISAGELLSCGVPLLPFVIVSGIVFMLWFGCWQVGICSARTDGGMNVPRTKCCMAVPGSIPFILLLIWGILMWRQSEGFIDPSAECAWPDALARCRPCKGGIIIGDQVSHNLFMAALFFNAVVPLIASFVAIWDACARCDSSLDDNPVESLRGECCEFRCNCTARETWCWWSRWCHCFRAGICGCSDVARSREHFGIPLVIRDSYEQVQADEVALG